VPVLATEMMVDMMVEAVDVAILVKLELEGMAANNRVRVICHPQSAAASAGASAAVPALAMKAVMSEMMVEEKAEMRAPVKCAAEAMASEL
jgi:hypothetical protein